MNQNTPSRLLNHGRYYQVNKLLRCTNTRFATVDLAINTSVYVG